MFKMTFVGGGHIFGTNNFAIALFASKSLSWHLFNEDNDNIIKLIKGE
jgi:hypothetical protein